MKKLLKPRDIFLLGLSGLADVFEEMRDPLGLVGKAYENYYGWMPEKYKKHHFNHLVWRNLKTGYVEKIIKNDVPYLRLTSQGQQKIQRDFPLLTIQKGRWDKKWRIVVFDIEETSKRIRERLRNKLKELGFGMLQKSVFISPYNIAQDFLEFLENLGLTDFAYIIEASDILVGDTKQLANKIWKLDELNNKYKEIIERVEEFNLIINSDRNGKLNDQKINREIRHRYLELLIRDPLLPKELLSDDWVGEKVRNLIKTLPRAEK